MENRFMYRNRMEKKHGTKSWNAIMAVAVALAFVSPWSFAIANELIDETIVSICPDAQIVKMGQPFDVEVYIEPNEPVCGVEFYTIYYDASIITATSVTYEGFFDPYATMPITPDLGVPGVITGIAEFTLGTETVTASNVFCTISFTADNVGTSVIDINES